ncbi:hypothetical protein [Ureibacillus sp. GCM10028918]|uniref:hypothetical protein n=1 Tax=Ureibacillus sp. GCM10028918 TaxID=3273429 RepID=UPI00361AC30E
MKKIFIIVMGLLFTGFAFIVFFNGIQKQEDLKILSELEDKGDVNGKREFLFSLTNVGENSAELGFLTWLEYNVAIDNLDNKDIPSGEIILEHIDLNENDEGRLLELEPNQKIEYRLLISNIPKGNYEITISSAADAADFGGINKQEFTVN